VPTLLHRVRRVPSLLFAADVRSDVALQRLLLKRV
jgi:hypothetical protein